MPGQTVVESLKSPRMAADPWDMRKLLRRLASPSCSACRGRRSPYKVACADCGADIRRTAAGAAALSRDSALVWLLGGALVGCLTMLAVAGH